MTQQSVFVTGGTGVLGRPVVRALVAQGYRVRVLAHSAGNEQAIRALGGEPVRADLFDSATLPAALGDAEAVLHLATRIPPADRMGKADAWAENDRIRTAGTRNLVGAALAGRVQTFVYPSVVLVYPDSGDRWLEAASAPTEPIAFVRSTMDSEAEVHRFAEAGRRGITLRMGSFYGPESGHVRAMLAYARRGLATVLGPESAYVSSIWIDDAAAAVVAALQRAPSGTYDVVDDAPVTRAELESLIARAAGKRRLWRLPTFVMRLMLGADLVAINSRSQRVSNRALREATGWAPRVPDSRDGWARLVGASPAPVGEQRLAAS